MSTTRARTPRRLPGLGLAVLLATAAAPALAQENSPADSKAVVVTTGMDFANQYMFRGVRQNSTGIVVSPFVALTARVSSNAGPLERIDVSAGFWNSVHSGDTGSGGPLGRPWYEARYSGALEFRFGRGISVASSYTSYTSPNEMFTTVKEIGVAVSVDDRGMLGAAAVRPYALVSFEIDTRPGSGQLDGGHRAGRYLELGVAPEYSGRRAAIAFPVKVGLSLRDYYELAGKDHRFGFVSVGAIASVPVGRRSGVGRWNVHAGVEIQAFGDATKVFNGANRSAVVASFGFSLRPYVR